MNRDDARGTTKERSVSDYKGIDEAVGCTKQPRVRPMKTSLLMVTIVARSSAAWKTRVPVDIEKVTKVTV